MEVEPPITIPKGDNGDNGQWARVFAHSWFAAIIAMITLKASGLFAPLRPCQLLGQVVNEWSQVDNHLQGISQGSANVDFDADDHAFTCSTLNCR